MIATEHRLNTPTLVDSEQTGLHPDLTVAVQDVEAEDVHDPQALVSEQVIPPVPPSVTVVAPDVVIPPVVLNNPEAFKVVNFPTAAVVAPTVPLMLMEAVPVRFVTVPEEGVPSAPPKVKYPDEA